MTQTVDDVHSFETGFTQAMQRLEHLDTSDRNKDLIKGFVISCRRDGLAKSTITGYANLLKQMVQRLYENGYTKDIDELEQFDFDSFLMYLEDVKSIKPGGIRNYKKVTKKFYRHLFDDDVPRWVQKLNLVQIESPVQPSDLLTGEEFDKLLGACRHPRDKALISVLADSGMRVGALASCRVKNVEFNQYGGIIYISTTSKSKKSTPAKGIPITWSTGYLNQWLSVHPLKDDPEAALWLTKTKMTKKNGAKEWDPLSYKSIRLTIQKIAGDAGIKKRVTPHSLRHRAITSWILDGLNEQEIKHRAGWSKGSQQMLKIYANFTDAEMNDKIFERYGLKKDDMRDITLTKCPRCNNILQPADRFCSQCSLVLDQKLAKEVEETSQKIPDALALLMSNPETVAMINEKIMEMKQ